MWYVVFMIYVICDMLYLWFMLYVICCIYDLCYMWYVVYMIYVICDMLYLCYMQTVTFISGVEVQEYVISFMKHLVAP